MTDTTGPRAGYLEAVGVIAPLLRRPEVAERWRTPSALQDFSVAGLSGHLAGQALTVTEILAQPPPADAPIPLLEHYARAAWVHSDIDSDVNVGIREGGEDTAGDDPGALADRVEAAVAEVRSRLPQQPADACVLVPWQGWVLSLDDFLVTRAMEVAVHADDLAFSVGVEPPALSAQAMRPVWGLLTDLAVRRHGQAAVLRALTRRERQPETVTAF
jgi:hypothetical protein